MPDEEIENIRQNANIIDIISSYIPLTQKGKNYFGVCPFHEDHSPSMSVSSEKQIYKCFSCGAAGNVFTFVKDYENVNFYEAVKIVADKVGLTFKGKINAKSKINNYKTEYEIMDLALKFYQNNLNTKEGNIAKEYLQKRQIDMKTIQDFEIGLALDYTKSLNKLLVNKKYSLEVIEALGLINRHDANITDTFLNRIIFPIHDLEGNPVGFTGRIYTDSNQARYINSKESNIFKKGQILFNYHRAQSEIKKQKEVIIVEGNMDAIRLYSQGIKNVVALMGTSLTKDQVNILKKLRAKIILMLDNDEAGEIATYQNGNILEENQLNPLVIRLSGAKDPDEYVLKIGIDSLISNLKKPLNFLDFKLNYLKKDKDLNNTTDLVNYIKEVTNSISNLDDLTKEITLKKISDAYNIPLEILNKELNKIKKNVKTKKEEVKINNNIYTKYDMASLNIIYYMMNDGIYIEKFKKDLGYFTKKKYRSMSNEIMYYYETNHKIDLASFISYIQDKDYIYEDIMEVIKSSKIRDIRLEDFEDYINVCHQEMNKEEIKNIKEQIENELDEAKKMALAEKLIEIKKGCVGYE